VGLNGILSQILNKNLSVTAGFKFTMEWRVSDRQQQSHELENEEIHLYDFKPINSATGRLSVLRRRPAGQLYLKRV
jgi:hypothetical protein